MALTESQRDLIECSIERVAVVAGDPTPCVYERLFSQHPEMKPLFILDTNGNARGHMLSEALACIFDFLGPRTYSESLIRSEMTNHGFFGVPPHVFANFFSIMMETFRELLAEEWTSEHEASWMALLAEFDGMVAQRVADRCGVATVDDHA